MHPFHRLAELIEDWQYLIRQDGIKSALPNRGREIARLPYRHLKFIILARLLAEPLPELQPKIPLEIHHFETFRPGAGASHRPTFGSQAVRAAAGRRAARPGCIPPGPDRRLCLGMHPLWIGN